MNDINNVELNVGDKVVYTYASAGNLMKGTIVRFTKTSVRIKYADTTQHSYVDSKGQTTSWQDPHESTIKNSQWQIMKLG